MAKAINSEVGLSGANKKQTKSIGKIGGQVVGFNVYKDGKPVHAGLPDSAYQSTPSDFVSQGIRKH